MQVIPAEHAQAFPVKNPVNKRSLFPFQRRQIYFTNNLNQS
jgi:hypothetical protein